MKRSREEINGHPVPAVARTGSAARSNPNDTSNAAVGPNSRYNYAVVCSSNINRSMEAHVAYWNNRLRVGSYGAGRFVRLPVPGQPGEGRTFEFGTPYEKMLEVLSADTKSLAWYQKTKLLDILRRNKQIKAAPERWQDTSGDIVSDYDVVLCFEQRIYDAVIEDLQSREPKDLSVICVICMETKDDPKEAVIAGRAAVQLAQKLEESNDLGSEAAEVVEAFMAAKGRRLLLQLVYL